MKVKVLFFSFCQDIVGKRETEVEVPEGATVADLVAEVAVAHPRFLQIEKSLMVSVNQGYVERGEELNEGDEVAFIPPVSGG